MRPGVSWWLEGGTVIGSVGLFFSLRQLRDEELRDAPLGPLLAVGLRDRWDRRDPAPREGLLLAGGPLGPLSLLGYRFVDCRWDLADPEAGRRAYLAGHIPGAVFLDVERDLSAPPGPGGRHPLPAAEDFAAAAGRAGIGPGVFVVAYGSMGGAERLWWLLRHFGHDDCAVLDLDGWHGPLRGGEESVEPERFEPQP